MLKVGIAGIGMMGNTHLEAYSKLKGVKVVAVADLIKARREGRVAVAGNVKGQAQSSTDFSTFRQYVEAADMIVDPDIDIIDICLPTPSHAKYAMMALKAGKHVLTEKPFARTAREAQQLAQAAAKADTLLMCAMCMRFWPAWTWLKEAIDKEAYGPVLGATFRRVTSLPPGDFYADADLNGGAILDLHIHDTDFIQHCFGKPQAVYSRGYSHTTSGIDHILTHYIYDHIPLVTAEGSWALNKAFGFAMQYTVNFAHATAVFDISAEPQLKLMRNGKTTAVKIKDGVGYEHEIAYFVKCVKNGTRPDVIDPTSAALSVTIVEAEKKSLETGRIVNI